MLLCSVQGLSASDVVGVFLSADIHWRKRDLLQSVKCDAFLFCQNRMLNRQGQKLCHLTHNTVRATVDFLHQLGVTEINIMLQVDSCLLVGEKKIPEIVVEFKG